MSIRKYGTALIVLLAATSSSGQFQLNGNAVQLNDSCYRLTPDVNWSSGSIWNLEKIDLNQSFEVVMDIYLGCKDIDGADGIVFGFQPVSTSLGGAGGGIGFQNIAPSLGIEFDTYQNFDLGDPTFDHIAIIRDGNLNHNSTANLAGPVQASPADANIEDCVSHELGVSWDATLQHLAIYFDCELRLSLYYDLVDQIFGGDPLVFWGFTSGTGALNNNHEVCFTYTTFLDQLEDVVLCPNGEVQLHVTGGVSYEWTPPDYLSDPYSPNPVASPPESMTYQVAIFDECGRPVYDQLYILVDGDSSFVELGADTLICTDTPLLLDATTPGAAYQWSTGATSPTLSVDQTGYYQVTVTIDDYCFDSDRIEVIAVPEPEFAFPDYPTLCLETELILDATFSGSEAAYEWQDGSELPTYPVSRAGLYSVTVTNYCGTVSSSVELEYEDCRQVYFPNAFSPDFDGLNDYFFPQDNGDVSVVELLQVFDRWGNLVFEAIGLSTNDPTSGWDGRFRGQKAPADVYVWQAEVEFRDGHRDRLSGDLHLLR